MTHKFTFKSTTVSNAISDAAECFLPSSADARHGMTVDDCVALARLQVNRFLTEAAEYSDEASSEYKFKLASGNKTEKRAEWSRKESTAGGLRLDEADEAALLGNRLGWFDQHHKAIEKAVGNYTVSLPDSVSKPLNTVWSAALRQRASRAPVAA